MLPYTVVGLNKSLGCTYLTKGKLNQKPRMKRRPSERIVRGSTAFKTFPIAVMPPGPKERRKGQSCSRDFTSCVLILFRSHKNGGLFRKDKINTFFKLLTKDSVLMNLNCLMSCMELLRRAALRERREHPTSIIYPPHEETACPREIAAIIIHSFNQFTRLGPHNNGVRHSSISHLTARVSRQTQRPRP